MANTKRKADGLRGEEQPAPRMDRYNAEFKGYINYNLSDDEKEEFASWLEGSDVNALVKAYTATGQVMSMKLDPKTGNFLASTTQRNEENVNSGLAVTARANDPVKALYRLLFILSKLGAGSWEAVHPLADPDRW